MSNQPTQAEINKNLENGVVKLADVRRAYSGKPGCMCGCRGKYYEAGNRTVTMIVRKMNRWPGRVQTDRYDNEVIHHIEINGRSYVTYSNK
jgi:hypothetical protein